MTHRARLPPGLAARVVLVSAAFTSACSVSLGDFDECHADADCTDREAGLVCRDRLCVRSGGRACDDDACRTALGYGAVCQADGCAAAPKNPACGLSEPPDLAGQDAPISGVLGLAWAAGLAAYDGFDVAEGLSQLSEGASVRIGPTGFASGVAALRIGETIDVDGTSGPLNFDAATGEAPGPIEIWQVDASGTAFETVMVVDP